MSLSRRRRRGLRDPETRTYHLGSGALSLGWRTFETNDLRRLALRVMRRLARKTEETARLGTLALDRRGLVILDELGVCRWIHDARTSSSGSSADLYEHGSVIHMTRAGRQACPWSTRTVPALGATDACAAAGVPSCGIRS